MIARLLVSVVFLVAPVASDAAVPDPQRSRCDPVLVGTSSGSHLGEGFRVTVRDVSNNPLVGKYVVLYLAGSASRPYAQQEPGSTVDCTALTLTRICDGLGQVAFHPRIAGFDNGAVVEVRANGVLLKRIPVRSTDMNADGTTDLRDLNLFRERFLSDRSALETDFDQNGVTNAFDFDRMREEILFPTHGTVCP